MITDELKSEVDSVWNAFWTDGFANPLEVIQQIKYLLSINRLDDIQTNKEKRAMVTGEKVDKAILSAKPQNCAGPDSNFA